MAGSRMVATGGDSRQHGAFRAGEGRSAIARNSSDAARRAVCAKVEDDVGKLNEAKQKEAQHLMDAWAALFPTPSDALRRA